MIPDQHVLDTILATGAAFNVDWRLVYGIAYAESSFRPLACRYESSWPDRWLVKPIVHAKTLGQTVETEIIHQKCSWGMMQVMGAVARELGFNGYLTQLCEPAMGIHWGTKKLQQVLVKYPESITDAISAYNAGHPRRQPDGKYLNEGYIRRVMQGVEEAKAIASDDETTDT